MIRAIRIKVVGVLLAMGALALCASEQSQAETARGIGSDGDPARVYGKVEVTSPTITPRQSWRQNGAVLFHEDFESGAPGWTCEGQIAGEPGCLWHLESRRSVSGDYSFAYNTGDPDYNYDVGRSRGRLMSPPVDLYNLLLARVFVSSWLETENAPGDVDMALICASTEGGHWSYDYLPDIQLWPMSQWVEISFDVWCYSGWIPAFRVGFDFDSVDGEDNDHEGWYIDEVLIVDVAVAVGSSSWGTIKALFAAHK